MVSDFGTLAVALVTVLIVAGCDDSPGAAVGSNVDAPATAASRPNTITADERRAGFKLLFDGETLDGWQGYRRDAIGPGWKVIDGTLVRAAGAGDIRTSETYGAFELLIDYRIAPGGNSGVMYHVTEELPEPGMTGPEIQLLDNEKGTDPQKSGWLYELYQPPTDPKTGRPVDATKPAGEWNTLRILVTPGKCATWVNGVLYYEYVKGSDDWNERVRKSKFNQWPPFAKAGRGYINLQDHGAEVAFRNIKLRPVEAKP